MPEMHLRQPEFTYSASGPFTKNKEKIDSGDSRYLYQNEWGKAFLEHDMAYEDFKDLLRRTSSDKVLCDKASNVAKNPKYDGYQCGLALMVYKLFDKKASGGAVTRTNN